MQFQNNSTANQEPSSSTETANKEILFIDATVEDYQSLAAGVKAGTEVVILDSVRDGIAQITEVLAGRTDIASVHIVSHGSEANLQLGSTQVNSNNLEAYTNSLQQWANALTPDADILLYGCNVAGGETGAAFVQQLSQLTGADVAASNDVTGSAGLGGDWDLEVATGKIEAPLVFKPEAMQTYKSILPAISLTSGGSYSQNFNTLSTTGTNNTWNNDSTIPGWYSNRALYLASDGGSTTGGLYSYGTSGSSDRALGAIASASADPVIWGVRLVNNTGSTLTSLNIAYTIEQWRAVNSSQTTNFQYKVGASSISETGYADFDALDIVSVNNTNTGAVDGNSASNRTILTQTLGGFSVNNGQEIWLRWNDPDNSGFDHGLAIDDFSISVPGTVTNNPPNITLPGAAVSYTENAAATVIDSTATVIDTDSLNFDTGKLTVDFTAGGTASDRLAIRNQGNGAGQIGLDGTIVKYGGVQIGTFKGGTGTTPLVITFNANATLDAATALLQNITYQNASDNPSTTPRTVRFIVTDGDGGTSTVVTETINVTAVNDAPIIGASVVKYDGSLNTTPNTQGFSYLSLGSATQTASGGATTLDTTANPGTYAGYFANNVPTLDRTTGYTVSFTAQVLSENHTTSTADKNGDGIADRAGFSIIVLSSDKKGIELGFWDNEIWAQEDGTTQANPSTNPSASNNQLLFTHAEGATFNTTTGLIPYQLTVVGDTYTLSTGGTTILSGKLRDYTAATATPDPYETPNLIFLGDDTTSASARVNLSGVSVTTNSSFAPQTVAEDTDLSITGVSVFDVDAGNTAITVTLEVNNGALTVNSTGLTVNGNGTGTVTLTGSQSQINANLAAANGLLYKGNQDFNGSDTLKITANDGAATSNIKTIPITVTSANDAPVLNNTGSPALTAIDEDVALASNNGTLVSDVIASGAGGNPITDADAGAVEGIAVIEVDNTNGTWQYSTDGGSSWNNFVVSGAAATVLKDTTSDRIRFVPNPDFNGITPGITFRAWDASDGLASGTTNVNPGAGGGASSFSIATETTSIIINSVNDAPSFTSGGNQNAIAGSGLQTVAGWASNFNPGATESTQSVDSYIVNVTSNPGIFATPPTIDPLTGNLTYTPTATIGTATTATVQVQVKDNGGTANGGVDTSVAQTFQITVNPGTPTVSIQAVDADAAEAGANTGNYQITRTGNTTGNLTVKFAVSNNSASSGDYTLTDSNGNAIAISNGIATVTLLAGQESFNITLTAVNDIQAEAAETLKLDLVADGAYAIASSQNTATVTIQQNDTVVINTNDSGEGSLRQAIINANAFSGTNTIGFQIGSGLQTITPLSALPTINDSVIIDGTTQPGFSGTPIIQLSGSGTGAGLTITAGDSTVRGLIINRFQDGIELSGGGNNVIAGNFIGTNAAGNAVAGNSRWGVFINGSSNNIIGGTTAGTRNIISGNSVGLFVTGSGNQIQGNYIGTDVTGNVDLGNTADGITIQGTNNIIGGTTTGARNVISGNNQNGVSISQVGSSGNQVLGNYIGTNAAGTADLGNTLNGIEIQYAPNNIIGGTTAGAGNVISGNNSNGIWITGNTATGNRVQGNYIGTNADGSSALGNTFRGVWLTDANDNTIGGTAAGTGNAIAFNGQQGVLVSSGIGNGILGNSIFSNTDLGIDLGGISVTANDVGDGDTGANNLQNFPLLTSAVFNGANTTVTGTFNSNPNATFRLEFFSNTALDASGNGEGRTFLGFTNVTTDASGNGSFTANLATVALGNFITATATNSNNTSEFSTGVAVTTVVSINAIDATAAESATDTGIYQITRTGTTGNLTVNLAVDGSSSASGDDYNLSSGGLSVVIPDGQSFVNVTLTAVDDTLPELAETLRLNLATGAGYTIDTDNNNATVAIASNDTIQYAITTAYPTLIEGDTGKQTATFTVTRNGGIGVASTVDYAIGGTATSGTDYNNILVSGGGTALSGTINFAAGETTKTITLDVLGDTTFEANENISVTLSNPNLTAAPESSTITTAIGQVAVVNDEKQPTISINDVNVIEGNSGTTNASYTISLFNASSETVTVNYATSNTTATTVDGDYTSVTSTPITFNPGEITKTIMVAVNGDNKFEPNETFNVNLTGATNATIAKGTGVATITNDDNQPTISINDVSVTEGNNDTTNASFTISLSDASSETVTVNYATSDGTATTVDGDYTGVTSTPITFNPGETTKTITVAIKGDNKFETNETFNVNLSGATNATIADNTGVGTITNDDNQPQISIDDVSITEGNDGTVNAIFTVSLSNPSSLPVRINYATANNTAIASSDYTTTNGTLTFNAGVTTQTISVPVIGELASEATESFFVNLSNPINATIADNQGIGTIIDNDAAGFTISPISGNTTEAGGKATFTVKLNSAPTADVTIGLTSSDTTEGKVSASSLTFSANNWNIAQTVTVTGADDAIADGNIPYSIITAPVVSTDSKYNNLNPNDVAVTNIDNDTAGFTITPARRLQTTEAGGQASFTVKLNSQPTANVTFGLVSSDTTEGISTSSLTFTPNNWNIAQTVTVTGVDDAVVDGNIAYKILTKPAVSADSKYNRLNPVNVAVRNADNDTAEFNVINGTLVSETLVGTTQSDRIYGFGGHDTISAGLGNDQIYGDDGNDTLIGDISNNLVAGGDDLIYGGTGSDRIYGNDGNDFLYGESGNDLIFGDSGNDLLRGGLGNDVVTGGTGRDTFVFARGEGTDIIQDFQIGSDFIGLAGGLSLGQLLITQRSSQTVITNNSNGELLAALNNVNAATFQSYASSTFVTI
ncbi:DUF4347 domain-containing protein [Funiculus sociatus GB2-A5]|uniref:DUF4347 domain-containing protein n=1 Tax=Funiculus sociatus GB2-A5 TaxID=2933946 RepID=A0ABV0JMJ0_9CYAN|nr:MULTISPECIES: DUF4347 domain-containing protein [unclassified Trichocoleus]MBD1906589.1 DUF4347 domain-containing protein [Trichocoleus sp. FACHB-832]MBD2063093.1 DUF4347 domain-containing protein [Trichocoleus sp. FACHB-6]